ncbi:hypothetical protein acsn021_34110 [Anaerocolumna cellulosilytica]|uniref:Uncharacterized protein n=1 Tax=Anaerocolumna cellulosilytica TaxID=433286 RepID=A0A6S6R9A7_9FIRM|nr:hypothetical protein [Anaerocolumna cellulosilytica]MBB5196764.1 hypothetical protein [Anaerocolumna cellulosilytica]BCJ95842.1 hypothetical protein acsn021_34110 [Anaerocolumna cellulosilytica]
MKKFSIKIEGATLKIVLDGAFGDEDIEAYGKEYGAAISKINPNQFTLELDARNMGVITPDKHEKLKQFFLLYKQQGFKTVTLRIQDSAILSMQVKRLAKEVGINDFRIL